MAKEQRPKGSSKAGGFQRAKPPRVKPFDSLRARALRAYRRQAGMNTADRPVDLDSTNLEDLNLEDLLDSDPEAA